MQGDNILFTFVFNEDLPQLFWYVINVGMVNNPCNFNCQHLTPIFQKICIFLIIQGAPGY